MKKSKSYRPKKILWDFNGDGRFDRERIKGKDKLRMKKLRRLYEHRLTRIEISNYENSAAV